MMGAIKSLDSNKVLVGLFVALLLAVLSFLGSFLVSQIRLNENVNLKFKEVQEIESEQSALSLKLYDLQLRIGIIEHEVKELHKGDERHQRAHRRMNKDYHDY